MKGHGGGDQHAVEHLARVAWAEESSTLTTACTNLVLAVQASCSEELDESVPIVKEHHPRRCPPACGLWLKVIVCDDTLLVCAEGVTSSPHSQRPSTTSAPATRCIARARRVGRKQTVVMKNLPDLFAAMERETKHRKTARCPVTPTTSWNS